MSTPDQKLASEIHGTALLLAQDERLQPLLEQLAQATADVMTFEPKRPASWRAADLLNRADISATSSSPPGYSFSLASPTATSSRRQCGLAFERGRGSLQTPVGQLVPGAAGARVLHRDRPLPGDDDDAVRVGAHSPGGREPAAQHLTESGVAPRVAVAEVGRCVGDAVADVFVEQADRDVLQEVTSGDQNKARDMVTEATRAIAGII